MAKIIKVLLSFVCTSLVFFGCNPGASSDGKPEKSEDFHDYWYQGKAEITTYQLSQARYGEMHNGKCVMIFVTEPFSKSKQVKLDNPDKAGKGNISVLKLNKIKRFETGIYDYSMMSSVFTPVDIKKHPHTLKVTTTSQDWCGHTFTQLNLKPEQYQARLYSYFESEGDQNLTLEKTYLEDEIWNLIRINPDTLPKGNFKMIQGTMAQRLRHTKLSNNKVNGTLTEKSAQPDILVYKIDYLNDQRTLTIRFKKEFPHEIVSWEDTYISGFGDDKQKMTTKAIKDKRIKTDYWKKNKNEYADFRKKLNLKNINF